MTTTIISGVMSNVQVGQKQTRFNLTFAEGQPPIQVRVHGRGRDSVEGVDRCTVHGSIQQVKEDDKNFLVINTWKSLMPHAPGLNSITLLGKLKKQAEVKFFESGKSVADFTIYVRENKDHTSWFNCKAWNKTGSIVADYVKEKEYLYVKDASLKTREYNGKYYYDISVNAVTLIRQPKEDNQQSAQTQQPEGFSKPEDFGGFNVDTSVGF